MTCLRTSLCELFGIDYPIVQAPIGSGTCPALAAAVSEAGGLGTLAVTWRSVEGARTAIRETRSRTDRTFGVNVVLDPADEIVSSLVAETVDAIEKTAALV